MSSAIELKFEQAATTGFAFSQRAFILGRSTMYFAMSLGFMISLSMRFNYSRVWGHLKLARDLIPKPSRSKTRPPASIYI